jgi:hypothetical protein
VDDRKFCRCTAKEHLNWNFEPGSTFLVIIPCQLVLTMEMIESADPARNFKLILVGRKEIQCEEWNKQFAKYKNVSGIYRQYSCF